MVIHGKRRGTAPKHVGKYALALNLVQGACQECVSCNKPGRQIEVANVMAFFIKEGFVAMNVDLNLEGRDQRESAMGKRTCTLQERFQPLETDIRGIWISRNAQAPVRIPEGHH